MKLPQAATLASLLTLPLLFACDSAAGSERDPVALTDAGYAALGESDWEGAREHFARALPLLEPGGTGFLRTALGEVEALIQLDAEQAKTRFLTLASDHPDIVGPREYTTISGKLISEQQYTQAIAVLGAGLEAHPGDPRLVAVLERIPEQDPDCDTPEAEAARAAMEKLASMGYMGRKH